MYVIETKKIINCHSSEVWNHLINFPAYPAWNPFIKKIEGKPIAGEKLSVVIQPPGTKEMAFSPTIVNVESNVELRWLGKLANIPGLFTGEHYFILKDISHEKTELIHGERFTGVLVPLFKKQLNTATRQGFNQMNAALAKLCEKALTT